MKFIRDKVISGVTKGLFMASGAVSPVEIAARCGYDWLLLDMEHGLGGEQETKNQIAAMDATDCGAIVRIPAMRSEYIKRILDFGASGIMAPMIENAAHARELVRAMRYAPDGIRGLSGGSRAAEYGFGFKEYFPRANGEILCIAQIECASAVEDIEGIAAVEGIDVLFIGHSDLSLNLGVYGKFDSPEMVHAEQAVLSAAEKYGKTPGMLLKASMDPARYLAKGFRFLALGTDHGLMKQAFQAPLQR